MRVRLNIGERMISNFICIIGLLFFIMSFVISSHTEEAIGRCTEEVQAVVSDLISERDGYGEVTYIAKFSYTVDNKEYVVRDSLRYSPSKYQVGDKVKLKYNPDKPDDIITDENIYKLLITLFRILGSILFIVGIPVRVVIRKAIRKSRQQ